MDSESRIEEDHYEETALRWIPPGAGGGPVRAKSRPAASIAAAVPGRHRLRGHVRGRDHSNAGRRRAVRRVGRGSVVGMGCGMVGW